MRVQRLPAVPVLGLLFFFTQAAIACYFDTSQHFGEISEVIRGDEMDKPLGSETLHCLTNLRAYQNANKTYNSTAKYFGSRAIPKWAGTIHFPTVNASLTWGQLVLYPASSLFPHQSIALHKLKAVYRI